MSSAEQEAVQAIQERLSPVRFPEVEGLECFAERQACGRPGGDFFDLVRAGKWELLAAIGSVATTGIAGAVLMSGLQAGLRSGGTSGAALPDLAGDLNRMLWDIGPENTLTTLFSARINTRRQLLHYVNAGQEAPLIFRSSGCVERLEPNAAVLGLSRRSVYRQRIVPFEPGDTLIALSDGVTEPGTCEGTGLREEDVVRMVRNDRGARVRELPGHILEAAESVAGAAEVDRTVLVVQFNDLRSGAAQLQKDGRQDRPAPIQQRCMAAA